jgi:hypothetical protein
LSAGIRHYLQKHAGSPEISPFAHCATRGAWHEISQRWPSLTALHMLPVLPTIELVVVPVLSVVMELVTLDWLSSMTEPVLPDEPFGVTARPLRDVMLPGDTVLPSRDVIVPPEIVLPSREMIVLDVPSDMMLCASTLVHSPTAANVAKNFFIAVLPKLSPCNGCKH